MCPSSNVLQNNLLKIPAANPLIVDEPVKAVLGKILRDRQCDEGVGPPIADKDGLLESCNIELGGILRRNTQGE